jgi:hypothetical protein
MKSDLEKEKVTMTKLWAKREKQIDRVLNNTLGMYGGIQGIIGSNASQIEALDIEALPTSIEDDTDGDKNY